MAKTLREFAETCGVTVYAASCVLSDPGTSLFPEEMRRRILNAARELGYMPALGDRVGGKLRSVGMLGSSNEIRSVVPLRLMYGILDAVQKHGLYLTVARLSDLDRPEGEAVVPLPRGFAADGLLVMFTHDVPPQVEEFVGETNVPAVWINNKRDRNCVYPNDYNASVGMTRHVMGLGHRRIAYVGVLAGPMEDRPHHYSEEDRYSGYAGIMRSAGLEPKVIVPPEPNPKSFHETMRTLLTDANRPTAVLTYSGEVATAVMHAAAEAGLHIPADLSVVAVSGSETIGPGGATTTSMLIPERRMGRTAVEMLLERAEKPDLDLPPRALKPEFVEGETCAPPP